MKRIIVIIASVMLGIPIVLSVVLFAVGLYLFNTADFQQPSDNIDWSRYELIIDTDTLSACRFGSRKLNEYGLWEMRIAGNPIDRGAAYGLMNSKLLENQESVFVEQIHQMIPSEYWVEFLHKLILIFNRNMANYIPIEYRQEIYAMSLSCSDKYNGYGSPYVRQLNYHAAHDIGHAMQEYMLVGCSSFATWGTNSEDGNLLIGRNFDFYMGTKFAENKLILFVEPTEGYDFVSVTWPGMMGVLSGMNEEGLTVTINAAKGALPVSSAMPISLLARHILQYASDISEAYEIAEQYKTFVSESLMIGSVKDGYVAVIEKTPERIALYKAPNERIVCTNHYQSAMFADDEYNKENMQTSDSPYRMERINELLDSMVPMNVEKAVYILRNRYGVGNKDIGIGNEKSVNQFIAHHSVVFQPDKLRMWVSTSPWQLGAFVCYDLHDVFGKNQQVESYAIDSFTIPADTASVNNDCKRVVKYREQYNILMQAEKDLQRVSDDFIMEYINNNPHYYQVYNSLGDYMHIVGDNSSAILYWQQALSMEIPKMEEKMQIINKIERYD